jgi:hypothetical protein
VKPLGFDAAPRDRSNTKPSVASDSETLRPVVSEATASRSLGQPDSAPLPSLPPPSGPASGLPTSMPPRPRSRAPGSFRNGASAGSSLPPPESVRAASEPARSLPPPRVPRPGGSGAPASARATRAIAVGAVGSTPREAGEETEPGAALKTPPAKAEPTNGATPRRPLPRLMLTALEPAELLFERIQEPSEESPILYHERAYLVDSFNSDDDLEEHLEAELSRIRRDWRHRDASQFVQLSLFDQRFYGEPTLPPIATLSWKDWQGRTEIWVRGVRRSTMPPGVVLDSLPPAFPAGKPLPRFSTHPTQRVPPASLDLLEELDAVEEVEVLEGRVPRSAADIDDAEELEALDDSDADDERPAATHSAFGESTHVTDAGTQAAETIPVSLRGTSDPIPLVPRVGDSMAPGSRRISVLPFGENADGSQERGLEAGTDSPPDSGPGWQSPEKSGEYLIPLPEEALEPPSSDRVLASEELLGALFERMHELSFVMTVGAAADYVVGALTEYIRCDGVLLHVLDREHDELVVTRAVGPNSLAVLTRRTRPGGSYLGESLRSTTPLELGPAEIEHSPGVWPALGLAPRYVITGSIQRREQPLGVIELCRSADKGPFSEGQLTALEYVCEQFSDFVADRPIDLERPSLYPQPPA